MKEDCFGQLELRLNVCRMALAFQSPFGFGVDEKRRSIAPQTSVFSFENQRENSTFIRSFFTGHYSTIR